MPVSTPPATLLELAHEGHLHAPTAWSAGPIATAVGGGLLLIASVLWLLVARRRHKRALRIVKKDQHRERIRSQMRRSRRVAAGGIVTGTLLVGASLVLAGTTSTPDPGGVRAVGDTSGDYPLRFERALESGDFQAEASNPTELFAYVQCQIGLYDEDDHLVTVKSYPAVAATGEREESPLYTTRVLLNPSGSQVFGANVTVREPAVRYEGTCEPVPMSLETLVQIDLPRKGLRAIVPESRPAGCDTDLEACLQQG